MVVAGGRKLAVAVEDSDLVGVEDRKLAVGVGDSILVVAGNKEQAVGAEAAGNMLASLVLAVVG